MDSRGEKNNVSTRSKTSLLKTEFRGSFQNFASSSQKERQKGEEASFKTPDLGGEEAGNRLMYFPEGSGAPPRAAGSTASELSAMSNQLRIIDGAQREAFTPELPPPGTVA